jgi:hypothetical protein
MAAFRVTVKSLRCRQLSLSDTTSPALHAGKMRVQEAALSNALTNADLLYGAIAIARFLGILPRQVRHLIFAASFKIGRNVCARKSSLTAWLERQEHGSKA